MSKALKFLSDARPEAMAAYFDFLRDNGSRLDPKTRLLISIITKVGNQTEAGLRQYARKGLEDGLTQEEILDGLMMAFPLLGLSKIVWAVDVLLDCGVFTEHSLEAKDEAIWHDVCAVDAENDINVLRIADRGVYAVRNDQSWRVFEAKCPHHGTDLTLCSVRDRSVECPLHQWRFDLTSGKCTRFGTRDLAEFPTRTNVQRVEALW